MAESSYEKFAVKTPDREAFPGVKGRQSPTMTLMPEQEMTLIMHGQTTTSRKSTIDSTVNTHGMSQSMTLIDRICFVELTLITSGQSTISLSRAMISTVHSILNTHGTYLNTIFYEQR